MAAHGMAAARSNKHNSGNTDLLLVDSMKLYKVFIVTIPQEQTRSNVP
jgi:hypothetical protein